MANLQRQSLGLGKRPALVVVDMINGFTDPACPLGSAADSVVAANQQLLQKFREKGLPVFFTTVIYRNPQQARVFRQRVPALDVLVPGSRWVEVDARLGRRDDERVVEKQWASGFFATDLHARLTAVQADSLVVTGLTTSGCVRATAVDGLQHDYPVVVPREAVGDRNPAAHEANLFDLHAKYADVQDLSMVLSQLESLGVAAQLQKAQ
jgi:maleamate amidohydrolase